VTTRGAFVCGRNAGISAYKHKDTILKETRATSRKVYSFTHKKISPGIKWSALVYFIIKITINTNSIQVLGKTKHSCCCKHFKHSFSQGERYIIDLPYCCSWTSV